MVPRTNPPRPGSESSIFALNPWIVTNVPMTVEKPGEKSKIQTGGGCPTRLRLKNPPRNQLLVSSRANAPWYAPPRGPDLPAIPQNLPTARPCRGRPPDPDLDGHSTRPTDPQCSGRPFQTTLIASLPQPPKPGPSSRAREGPVGDSRSAVPTDPPPQTHRTARDDHLHDCQLTAIMGPLT